MRIERYKGSRFWALYDEAGTLVVVTVYKRGAAEVQRRLTGPQKGTVIHRDSSKDRHGSSPRP